MVCCCQLHLILLYSLCLLFLIRGHTNAYQSSFAKSLSSLKYSDRNSKTSVERKIRSRRDVEQGRLQEHNKTDSFSYDAFYVGPVCELIDVTNDPNILKKDLQNCEIVNGFVHILFMNDHADPDQKYYDMDSYSFPKLRVITEYLLIYRVYGITSLKKWFPNLVMVGGRTLFQGYAMVIYENPHLTEIGLGSLQYINRGSVRIQNNGKLCFLSTIDWKLLGKVHGNDELKNPVLKDNKVDGCIDQCGDKSCKFEDENGVLTPYCWGVKLCQKRPYECGEVGRQCRCHEECLGGCSLPNNASACYVCRNLYHNLTCVPKCPKNTYLAYKWRCVDLQFCSNMGLILHDGECIRDCPQYHKQKSQVDNSTSMTIHTCARCNGSCARVCSSQNPIVVTNRISLNEVHRCTIINAQLVISVGGTDLEKELRESLGELQQVDSLVIRRSEYLTSLSFFKSLKYITGKKHTLAQLEYSVYVVDNKRLRDLWGFNNGNGSLNLKIGGGKAFFHFNPYLCLSKAEKISNLTVAVEDSNDISSTTNGDRTTCNMERIENVTIVGTVVDGRAIVIISWKTPEIADHRALIGYHIYFKSSKYENASRFETDASGRSSWSIMDVDRTPRRDEIDFNEEMIHNLTPFTKYAFYIVTYTTAAVRQGAQSDIYYYTTEPSRPSPPPLASLVSLNYSAIVVTWEPPHHPNGIITHYRVRWRAQRDDRSVVNSINTCIDNGQDFQRKEYEENKSQVEEKKSDEEDTVLDGKTCCSCDKRNKKTETEIIESQTFEDFLINFVIDWHETPPVGDDENEAGESNSTLRRKRSVDVSYSGYKRSLNSTSMPNMVSNLTTNVAADVTATTSEKAVRPSFLDQEEELQERVVVNTTTMTLTGLDHFTEYYFEVVACNHAHLTVECGFASIATRRTKKLETADNISSTLQLQRNEEDDYVLHWDPPADPNSFIKYYLIQLVKQSESQNRCCSAMEYNKNRTCVLQDIRPGTYEASVLPVSLADFGVKSPSVKIVIENTAIPINQSLLYGVVGVAVFLLLFVVFGFFSYRRWLYSKKPPIYASVNPEYSSVGVYEPDEYELEPDDIQLIREIGQGHFGKVYEGLAQKVIYGQAETQVAVKTLHGNETISKRMEFLKEASVMKAFDAHHVVRLLGVVSTTNKPMVVMEYMEFGDLKCYLRSTRPDAEKRRGEPPTLQQKLQMCGEIADGMAYLAARKFVHRDLAARNCLVRSDMTVKIGDFGLTRDVYETDYYRIDSRGILPVRWMAPESLKDGVFDSRSDVWSYGVVLWEIANLAEQPYQGQQHDQVTRFVIDGGYMEQPKDCPKKLYDLMLMCWHYSPGMRPTFMEIVSSISPDLSDKFKQVAFCFEPKESNEVAEDEAYLGDSLLSSDSVMFLNNSDGKGSLHPVKNTFISNGKDDYCHLNGVSQKEQAGDGDAPSEKEDTLLYIPKTVRQNSTIC